MEERKRKTILWIVMILVLGGLLYMQAPMTFTPFAERLVSDKELVRVTAFEKLDSFSDEKKRQLLPDIIALFARKDPEDRKFALYALRRIGVQNDQINAVVLEALKDPSPSVSGEAIQFIGEVDFASARYVMARVNEVPDKEKEALINLLIQIPEKSGPSFSENLTSESPDVALFSARGIKALKNLPAGAGETLLSLLENENPDVRTEAALTLAEFGKSSEAVVEVLLKSLGRKEDQFLAAEALGKLGSAASKAVPSLEKMARKAGDGFLEEAYLKPSLAQALHKIKPRKTDLAGLGWDLKSKDALIRYRAAWYASTQAGSNQGLAPHLVNRLDDSDPTVAARSLLAMGKVGLENMERFQDEVTKKLLARIEKEMNKESVEGFSSLISQVLGPLGTKLMPQILGGLQAGSLSPETVDKIIQGWKPFEIKSLEAYLDYGDPRVRFISALNLARVGGRRKDLVPLLREKANVNDDLLKEASDWAERIESF